jgi:hypothetical protein
VDYSAGLDISMDETDVCVLDREGVLVCESKTASTAEAPTSVRIALIGIVGGNKPVRFGEDSLSRGNEAALSLPVERWREWGLQDLAEVKCRSPGRAEDNDKFPQAAACRSRESARERACGRGALAGLPPQTRHRGGRSRS